MAKLTEKQCLAVVREYETVAAASTNTLAKKYGVSSWQIHQILKRSGTTMKPTGVNSRSFAIGSNVNDGSVASEKVLSVLTLWDAGRDTKFIAKTLGLTRFQVMHWVILHRSRGPEADRVAVMAKRVLRSSVGKAQYTKWESIKRKPSLRGRCDVCKELSEKLYVDHSHTTGLIRGLLCSNCNAGIGFLQDNPRVLLSASRYLANS